MLSGLTILNQKHNYCVLTEIEHLYSLELLKVGCISLCRVLLGPCGLLTIYLACLLVASFFRSCSSLDSISVKFHLHSFCLKEIVYFPLLFQIITLDPQSIQLGYKPRSNIAGLYSMSISTPLAKIFMQFSIMGISFTFLYSLY